MEIFEQYFSKQLGYTYYQYTEDNWINKGIDSIVINKQLMPNYVMEIIETEEDDYFYFPVFTKQGEKHRFVTSEADYLFYFKKSTVGLYSAEPQVIRPIIRKLWQDEGAKYNGAPLVELANGNKCVALPMSEFDNDINSHFINSPVTHLLKNYGKNI